jgi:surface antigen
MASRLSLCTALLGLAAGGCSLSYQLGSLLENGEDKPKQGALAAAPRPEEAAAGPSEGDLARARAAVVDALAKNGTTKSTAWENPQTGARGTITPIAAASPQDDGSVCRDFLASYVHGGNETWLEGAACRGHKGRWEVRRLTPWKRT